MKTLTQAIESLPTKGGAGASLLKHLTMVGILSWGDLTKTNIYDLRDHLKDAVAPSTAKTLLANLKAILNRYSDEVSLPDGWEKLMSVKGDESRGTFFTADELKLFEAVPTKSKKEEVVKIESLIEAYTGARVSDVQTFTEENFSDGFLTYTSLKTKVTATLPVSEKTKGWIRYAQANRDHEPTLAARNRIIRRLSERAGITETVKIRRAGEDVTARKCDVVSSHSFRKSTATNLILAGASLSQARLALGHTSEAMTRRYVVATKPTFTKEALAYFGV